MSISDAVAGIDAAADRIDAGAATVAHVLATWEEAITLASAATAGSARPEAAQALALLTQARHSLATILNTAQSAKDTAHTYRAHLAGNDSTPATKSPPVPRQTALPRKTANNPDMPTTDKISELVRDLPPPVVPNAGQKTHGRWFGEDGEIHSELSGKDDKHQQAVRVFEQDMRSRRIPSTVVDVEIKVAAHMRANGIRSATLAINNQPCGGPMGCDALVPVVLPPGYTLTVIGPNGFRREYKGGATSRWVP